jgi:hypothetical protein
MRPFRKHLLTLLVALALLLPFAGIASADPNDGGYSSALITTISRGVQ